jgi:hypothetical protein
MENETLGPHQALQIIESMINTAKNRLSSNGHLYLLWGWVVLTCSLLHFAGIYWKLFPQPEVVWLGTWVAGIYQVIYLWRHGRKKKITNYTDDILRAIWLVFVCCGAVTAFVVIRLANWQVMYALILMLYGIPTILSGVVLRFRPLIVGGLICWSLSAIATIVPLMYNLLLIAVAVVVAWIVPGYLLNKKYIMQLN